MIEKIAENIVEARLIDLIGFSGASTAVVNGGEYLVDLKSQNT